VLEHLAYLHSGRADPHPLQIRLEEVIEEVLDDYEKEIFYLRFGEQLSFRHIARHMGYSSHQTFQLKVEKILEKVKVALATERI
jgi:DNA-directed RNA polymerase specialized sigma subunit